MPPVDGPTVRYSHSSFRRLSSEDLPERGRDEAVHDMYVRTIFKHDRVPLGDEPFRCTARIYQLPGLGMASIKVSPCRSWHSKESTSNDDVVLTLTQRGSRHVVQRGREVTLGANDAELMSSDPSVSTITGAEFLSIRLRRAELGPLATNIDDCVLRPIRSSIARQLLPAYVAEIEEAAEADVETRRLVVSHVYDLVALVLGANRDAVELASGRGVRAARLRAIKDDVLANLGDETLSIGAVALRHAITPRYVSMLFDGAGTTFAHFVLAQRLRLARRMLAAWRHRNQPISAIAFACGFSDLSYFNRTFKRTFGATPSDIRAAAREN